MSTDYEAQHCNNKFESMLKCMAVGWLRTHRRIFRRLGGKLQKAAVTILGHQDIICICNRRRSVLLLRAVT